MIIWKQEVVQTTRGTFEVFRAGSGQPLCITHLYSEFSCLGHPFADAFTPFYSVFLVNLREAGRSVKACCPGKLSMDESIEDLEAIRIVLGFDTWSYAGTATGGMLGLKYAITHPQSLASLVLCSTAASNAYRECEGSMYNPNNDVHRHLCDILDTLRSPDASIHDKIEARRAWNELSLLHPERYEEYFTKHVGRLLMKRLNAYLYELESFDLRPFLPSVTLPTLVLSGQHDAQYPLECSEEMHRLLPNAELVVFAQSSHFPYLEESERFVGTIASFCKKAVY